MSGLTRSPASGLTSTMPSDEGPPRAKPSLADILAGVLAEPLDGPAARPILAKRKRLKLRLAQQRRKLSEEAAQQRVECECNRRESPVTTTGRT